MKLSIIPDKRHLDWLRTLERQGSGKRIDVPEFVLFTGKDEHSRNKSNLITLDG